MQTRSSPNIETLHRYAQHMEIPDFEDMPKPALFARLQQQFDFRRLQRADTRRIRFSLTSNEKKSSTTDRNSSVTSKQTKKSRKADVMDPILFDAIPKKFAFLHVRPNGTAVCFNAITLIDYMLATGDFSEPESRMAFTDAELQELDSIASRNDLHRRSVLESKNTPNQFEDLKFRRDGLLGLERCAGEVVTAMLTLIETGDTDETEYLLVTRDLPLFDDYYRQLNQADSAYASNCIQHWIEYLRGPPNKRNRDRFGIIGFVIDHLKTKLEK